jgi:arylsulfatase A
MPGQGVRAVPAPNIVLILADDLGYGDFGVFGDGSPQTPAIDRLISEGLCLTQHYSGAPVCAPARAALLTGRYPHRTGAVDTLESRGLDRLALRERTLADRLKQAGYATGLVGKWHLGALDPRYHPNARGFDEFTGFRGGWSDYYRWRLDCNGAFRPADGRYLTDVLTDAAVDFVTRHRAHPFFLHVAYNAPHFPFQAPEEDIRDFAASGRLNKGLSIFYAMVRRMDAGVARILEALDRRGLRENTLVLFTRASGPQLSGEGDMSIRRFNAWLSGSKGTTFEGGIRVPAIISWPGHIPQGEVRGQLAHACDWLPTVAAYCGLAPLNPDLDGKSLATVISSAEAPTPHQVVHWQVGRGAGAQWAVRRGDWKLIGNPRDTSRSDRSAPLAPLFLSNLAEDLGETRNHAGDHPELARELRQIHEQWLHRISNP